MIIALLTLLHTGFEVFGLVNVLIEKLNLCSCAFGLFGRPFFRVRLFWSLLLLLAFFFWVSIPWGYLFYVQTVLPIFLLTYRRVRKPFCSGCPSVPPAEQKNVHYREAPKPKCFGSLQNRRHILSSIWKKNLALKHRAENCRKAQMSTAYDTVKAHDRKRFRKNERRKRPFRRLKQTREERKKEFQFIIIIFIWNMFNQDMPSSLS